MRITFLLPLDALTGGTRVVAVYAARLAKRGHTVTVIYPQRPRPSLRQMWRSFKKTGKLPPRKHVGHSFFDGLPINRIELPHPGPILPHEVPEGDILLATWWETAEWLWNMPATKGMKAHFMQDYEIWGGNVPRVDATCRLPIPKIVIARWVSNLLVSRFGQEPLAYIPNSVDTDLFAAPERSKQATPTVGFTYTFMPNKGTDITLEAIRRARLRLPNLKVVSFGASSPISELPLPEETDFYHRVPDRELPSIYASCDAWLFGTRIEGFGLPILEAMACRTPVIGTPAGAAPELLSHGSGIQVAMEDPDAMADAIVRIAHMPDREWAEMSENAYGTATSYSWDDATDRFEEALEQVRTGLAAQAVTRSTTHRREAGVR